MDDRHRGRMILKCAEEFLMGSHGWDPFLCVSSNRVEPDTFPSRDRVPRTRSSLHGSFRRGRSDSCFCGQAMALVSPGFFGGSGSYARALLAGLRIILGRHVVAPPERKFFDRLDPVP